jgi:glycosyltransferase involved in cell wall biosynthesis
MGTPFITIAPPEGYSSISSSQCRVCVHVLRQGRSDYRLIRGATALSEAGFSVTIVDVETERTCPVQEYADSLSLEHIVVPTWHKSRKFEPWFFIVAVKTFFLSILRLMCMRADIYHACELTALPACYIVSRLLRKPLIFEIYDLQFPVPETGVAFWRRVGAYLYGILLPRCAAVIVTSPFHTKEIRDRFRTPALALVRNIPKYREVQKTDRLRQYLGLSPSTRIALYQGYIQSDRGLDALVHVAPFLEVDTVIVIKGKGSDQARLEALIADRGVADRIKVIPFVPYDEMLDWVASADIGLIVHPPDFSLNVQTLLPNKLFEYLMAGLPVLTSDIGAVVDIVQDYDVGQVVTSVEPGAIGAAINAMLADDAALHRMSQNALEAARNELNWEKESLQLVRLYEDFVVRFKGKRNVVSHKD